jgi:cell division protein FtsW
MNELLKKYLKGDPVIWMVFILLCLVSAVEMFSASSSLVYRAGGNITGPVSSHIAFLLIGIFIVLILQNVSYKYFRVLNYLLLIVAFAALVFTLFQGVSAGGAKRWINMGFFQFQPSELAKISIIIFSADMLARNQQNAGNADGAFKPILIAMITFCLLIFTENFSTAALIFLIGTLMMIVGRVSWKKIFSMLGVVIAIGSVAFFIGWKVPQSSLPGTLKRLPTQVNRIITFANTENSENESKYIISEEKNNRQTINGQIAIANGQNRIIPKPGSSIQRDYLPEAYSDFIYAIIIEEMGLFGGISVIILYLILLYRAGVTTFNSTQTFPALMVMGLTLMIVIQAFASMAVATGLGPVTGQPLPLISRGGTSILITCAYFGMILSVTRSIKEESEKNTEEMALNK